MRDSLSLHLSLFRKQKARIGRVVEGRSSALGAYEARYRRATRRYERPVTLAEVDAAVEQADVVYVGDYHTLRIAQESYLRLVERALGHRRKVALALEVVEGRHQRWLDAFFAGRIGERAFRDRIGHAPNGGFDLFAGFRPIFELARSKGLRVIGIDRRGTLEVRDRYAAARIAELAHMADRPRVMVLMGQFHVTPCHLPARVRELAGELRPLVVYQNCESIYFQLLRRKLVDRVEAVRIREGELCLLNTSPVVCQQSFLDYVEAESGDEPLDCKAPSRFREMAQMIGDFVGVPVERELERVEVATVADVDFLSKLKARGRFGAAELEKVRRQVLSRESYYIPRARMAFLATLSLNHAAEEAAHFVRHCAVGDAMDAHRRPSEAFYARCLEEALGFFGSKLVNPRRRCVGLAEWASRFEDARGEERQVAAFVLAHKAAERDGPDEAAKLLPLRQGRLFNAVSHALGYLLGDALYRAFDARCVSRREIRALFCDPLDDPRTAYFAWSRRLG